MGAKYMIFLVKHHDGFCLYDTKLTDYRITGPASAWKHDVMKDVADACHAAGLKLILYYSQPDWHHPDYRTENHARYVEYFHGQVRELLTNYGRIDGLWFDLGGTPEEWQTEKLFKMARSIQPWLIINNRVGLPGDFDTPENQVGYLPEQAAVGDLLHARDAVELEARRRTVHAGRVDPRPGELCDRRRQSGTEHRPHAGRPDRAAAGRDASRDIGQWLKKYGESIYGTRGGPFVAPDVRLRSRQGILRRFQLAGGRWWGGSTRKDNFIYLHILRWPTDTITLPAIERKIVATVC